MGVTVVDENHPDRERMVKHLKKIQSDNLKINIGAMSCLKTIDELRKIRPTPGMNTIYIWYGLDKLKNELFLLNQDNEVESTVDGASGRFAVIASNMLSRLNLS